MQFLQTPLFAAVVAERRAAGVQYQIYAHSIEDESAMAIS